MDRKAKILRVLSSICMAIILGAISSGIGVAIFITSGGAIPEAFLEVFLFVCFLVGLLLMWITHRFYHQTRILYIILLVIGIPSILIGLLLGVGSFGTLHSLNSADIPGEQQEHAVLGGVMMLMGIAAGVITFVGGLLLVISSILGLWAFKIRAKLPPPL